MAKWQQIEKPKYVSAAESKKIGLFNDDVRFVRATYEPGKPPELFKTFDGTIQIDDLVTVLTETRHNMTIVRILEIDVDIDFENHELAHWIVSKVETGPYLTLMDRERHALSQIRSAELRKKREDLRAALFKNQNELMKTLDIAKIDETLPAPQQPPSAAE